MGRETHPESSTKREIHLKKIGLLFTRIVDLLKKGEKEADYQS